VRRLERDALHVECELAVGLGDPRLLEEVDLVVQEQRLEVLLDTNEVAQAFQAELAFVLAQVADRREERGAGRRVADGLEREDVGAPGGGGRHVRPPRRSRRCAAPASGWEGGPAPASSRPPSTPCAGRWRAPRSGSPSAR